MSLNPVQFGTEVVDQFGRYLMTTFPIADPRMEAQVREALRHDLGGERLIAKGPFVCINQPFQEGRSVAGLCADARLGLHPVLADVFPYDAVSSGAKPRSVQVGTGLSKQLHMLALFAHI
jgi:hypothetical protein